MQPSIAVGIAVATHPFMMLKRLVWAIAMTLGIAAGSAAQTPPKEPPPLWDAQVGGSFVGTSGNTDTSTIGADLSMNRRGAVWRVESTATAVRTTDRGLRTAERYLGAFRISRKLTSILGVTAGERAERDRLAGMDFRNILDGGLSWALVRTPGWTLDSVTALAWNHEEPLGGPDVDHPIGVLQALSRIPFGTGGDTTQRFTYFPDLRDATGYRSEAEVTAQAAINSRLALKLGYLWRYSNSPVPGFTKTDNTTTASVVLRWRASTPAPAP
jgi:putative salt-induced outer membrane protein YdiY